MAACLQLHQKQSISDILLLVYLFELIGAEHACGTVAVSRDAEGKMADPTKYLLTEDQIPTDWYNILADLPTPLPLVLHPGTGQPIGPADLAPLFPMEVIKQEVSTERYIEIPQEVI